GRNLQKPSAVGQINDVLYEIHPISTKRTACLSAIGGSKSGFSETASNARIVLDCAGTRIGRDANRLLRNSLTLLVSAFQRNPISGSGIPRDHGPASCDKLRAEFSLFQFGCPGGIVDVIEAHPQNSVVQRGAMWLPRAI